MPTIRPYQQQVSPEIGMTGRNAQASDLGHTGFTQVGNAVQSATQDAAQATAIIQRNRAQQEATDADLNATLASVTLTEKLQAREKAWKPGDLPLIGEAAAEMQQTLDGMKYREDGTEKYETSHGRTVFEQRAAHLTAQYLNEASRAQARLDGVAAVAQFNTLTAAKANFLATGVNYLHLESSLQEYEQSLHTGIYENLPNEKRAELFRMGKSVLAENAMEGMIRDNPKGAMAALQGGFMAGTLDDGKVSSLLEKARVMDHLYTQAAKSSGEEFIKAQEAAALSQYSQATQMYLEHRADPTKPQVTPTDLNGFTNMMARHPEHAIAIQNLIDRDMKEAREGATKGDPWVYRKLFDKISKNQMPSLDPVNKARSAGQLSAEQHNELIGEFNDARTPEGLTLTQKKKQMFDAVAPLIAPKNAMGALVDNSMGMRVYEFEHDAQQAIARAKKEGKDPYALLDPKSPDYLGTPERIKPYTKTFMEQIDAALEQRGLGATAPAPAPGAAPAPAKPRKPLSEIFK